MSTLVQSVGAYAATYQPHADAPGGGGDPLDLGDFEGSIITSRISKGQEVRASRFGQSVIDIVYQGMDAFLILTIKEWTTAIQQALWPWSTAFGNTGHHGQLASNKWGHLTITAYPGTTAATLGPVTRHGKVILSPEHNEETIFGTEERNIPVVFRYLGVPVVEGQEDNSTDCVFWTDT